MNNQRIVVSLNLKRTIKIMKLTVLMLAVCLSSVVASTYAQTATLNVSAKNETLEKVLKQIEKQSEFLFFYNLEEVNKNEKISIRKKNANIQDVLDAIATKTGLRYTIKDRHIVLTTEHVSNAAISQQSQKVTGVVSDLMGPVAGANVIQKGTTNGTTTDLDGKFSIEVPANATLQISFIGYISQDIAVKGQSIINVTLKEDSQALHNAIKDAYNAGILLIAAAGNTSQVEYPAAYEEVVAVGAVDSDGIVCDNSAKGDEIELVAPGEKIASTGGYEGILISSGTSMAAPHVTGLASLLWQKDMSMSSEFIRSLLKASANNYGDTKSYGYGLIDCKYADKIYASFKEKYSKNGTASNVEQYNNTAVVTTLAENTYVEGSWNTAEHQGFIGTPGKLTSANISEIKQGIVFPDKKGGIIQGVKKNPAFHGARNYVLNSIYLSYIARDGKIQEASKYFDSDIINANKNILDDMYNKLTQCGNSITGRYFLWGIALHNLTDTYAHQAYIRNPYNNQWYFLIHPDSDKVGCPGHLVGSDNPYIARGRFDSTQISATLGLTELLNGNAWTFRVYEHSGYFQSYYSREMDGFEYYHWEFKLKNLYKNAREVDFGAGYSNVLKQATYGSVK